MNCKAYLFFTSLVFVLGCGNNKNIEQEMVLTPLSEVGTRTIHEILPLENQHSGWRMVVRGSFIEHLRSKVRWEEMSLTTPMNRFTVHNTSIGPIERWPYYYSGESCVYAVVGYTDLNYAPWCIGAEHIIESKTNIDGVLFISDPDFPLIFRFTEDGLTYLSGRGKAILRSGEALLFNPTDDASEWTDLLQSSNVLQRRGAALALGQLKHSSSVTALIEAAQDSTAEVRSAIAESLGKLGDIGAADALAKLTKDENNYVARIAAEALGNIRTEKSVDALIQLVDTAADVNNPRISDVAAQSLLEMAKFKQALNDEEDLVPLPLSAESKQKLLEMLKQTKVRKKRTNAVQIAGLTGDNDFIDPVEVVLKNKGGAGRSLAVVSLALLKGEEALNLLESIFQNPREKTWVRRNAAWMIGRVGKEKGVQILATALDVEADEKILIGIALGLGQTDQEKAAEVLFEKIRNTQDADLAVGFAETLSHLGPSAKTQLLDLANHDNSHVRYWAIKGLGRTQDKKSVPTLIDALADSSSVYRTQAAKALRRLGFEPRTPKERLWLLVAEKRFTEIAKKDIAFEAPLMIALKDWSWEVRLGAAKVLGLKKSESSVEALLKALKDDDFEVRAEVARSLRAIGWEPRSRSQELDLMVAEQRWNDLVQIGQEAVPILIALFDNDFYLQPLVCNYLSQIGMPAIPELIDRLGGEYDVDSRWAGEALIKMGDTAFKPLVEQLESPIRKKRIWAARTLGNLGNPEAITYLSTREQNESYKEVKNALTNAISKLNSLTSK